MPENLGIEQMKEQESNFSEWVDTLTISDASNILLLIAFLALILVFVIRAFRNKPSA